jgi:hypothetical protein
MLGSMPSTAQILGIVESARKYDHGSGVSEDEWNPEVQHPLLKLARNTSEHRQTLDIRNVKTARSKSAWLARSTLPGRVVNYVVTKRLSCCQFNSIFATTDIRVLLNPMVSNWRVVMYPYEWCD